MKKFIEEFKAFALRGNMMDMAIGVLIGGAFTGIVTSLTENFITPVITTVLSLIGGAPLYTAAEWYGFASNFVSAIFNFFITALVLFLLLKAMNKLMELGKKKDEEPAAPHHQEVPLLPQRDPRRGHPLPALHLPAGGEQGDRARLMWLPFLSGRRTPA